MPRNINYNTKSINDKILAELIQGRKSMQSKMTAFHPLAAHHIENCLCIYKEELRLIHQRMTLRQTI